jgi:type II secretory pathway component GspD/PulD (secretin)
MTEQSVRVRNGEKAILKMSKSMPMQWVRSVSAQSAALSASGASASSTSGAVKNDLVWLEAGQSLQVQPRWPGGTQPVSVEITVESASIGQRTGTELPDQSKSELATTVSLPLGQWVTIASSGSVTQPGTYSSQAVNASRRLLQVRVLAP